MLGRSEPAIEIRRADGSYLLEQCQRLGAPVDEVFAFFSDPHNLEELTPERLSFEVLEVDGEPFGEGTRIRYRLRLRGLPLRWVSRIDDWDPPSGFVDVQEVGPYRRWEHAHRFEPDDAGTLVTDRVRYELPGGFLGRLANPLFVAGDLRRIFAYRARRLAERFPATSS